MSKQEQQEKHRHQQVELGFVQSIDENADDLKYVGHRSYDYNNDWDGGGQIGGRPSWLIPCKLPKPLHCKHCASQHMAFVCQIYAPIEYEEFVSTSSTSNSNKNDDGDGNNNNVSNNNSSSSSSKPDRAFHRTLYVFACPACTNETGSVRVLRGQLSEVNPYYPASASQQQQDDEIIVEEEIYTSWDKHLPSTWKQSTCSVCGMAAKYKCPLQNKMFCSKLHQKEYKKTKKGGTSSNDDTMINEIEESRCLPSLYPLSELVVETEPDAVDGGGSRGTLFDTVDDDDDDDDSDRDLEQEDLNAIVRGEQKARRNNKNKKQVDVCQDPYTMAFYNRIKERPNVQEQCLRYCRKWPSKNDNNNNNNNSNDDDDETNDDHSTTPILWIQGNHRPKTIPPCPFCQAPRKFEFQLMPQLLHYLLKKDDNSQNSSNNNNNEEDSTSNNNNSNKLANQTGSTNSNGSNNNNNNNDEYETFKEALRQTEALIEEAPPEVIPPSLVDGRNKAVERVRNCLGVGTTTSSIGGSSNSSEHNNNGGLDKLDWGVVAVYTCTASCGGSSSSSSSSENEDVTDDDELGAYKEEFAWRQPSLDS